LDFAGKTSADVYILHQANKIINEAIAKRAGIANQVVPSTLYHFGNTASASIPLTLQQYLQESNLQNQWVLMCGFGVGFSVASVLTYISSNIVTEIMYV
jgi:3-oxoacyl-[acyl-carrier-protein] synthase III